MDREELAESEHDPAQPARRLRRLGRLSGRQEHSLRELLSGGVNSIRWVAQEAYVPESTLRRWLAPDHPFRQEYERRLRERRELREAAIATARDPKCSPWTRLQAIVKAQELMGPDPSPQQEAEDRMLTLMLKGCTPDEIWALLRAQEGEPGTADEGA
jgi:hypothetical protein